MSTFSIYTWKTKFICSFKMKLLKYLNIANITFFVTSDRIPPFALSIHTVDSQSFICISIINDNLSLLTNNIYSG